MDLLDLALYNLDRLSNEKRAFAPPMDPAAAQGAPPMDPAMMAAAGGGMPPQGAPMDPAMMAATGGAPAPAPMPPPAPAAPAPDQGGYDGIVNAVRQVMMEMGTAGGNGGKGGGKGGKDMEERLSALEGAVAQLLEQLGVASPSQALNDAVVSSANGGGDPKGMSAGSGEAAQGPMDPNAAGIMNSITKPNVKMGEYPHPLPLDGINTEAARKFLFG
jgi:hypothetical protein